MTMTRKTYGVSGLMEWQAVIRCGRATVNVLFTGGSVTGYGVSPAEYTTENPVVQAIIEGSEYYKSGRIRLLRQSGVAATADASATVAREVSSADASAAVADVSDDIALQRVSVASLEEARDYLADSFDDVRRKDLMSKRAIKEVAAAHSVVFDGIDL